MDFSPFVICAPGVRPPKPRGMDVPEGLGDRMRTAAFAEFQAVAAFRWAAERFRDAPPALREAWSSQVGEEARHFGMIRRRMEELGFGLADRPVSTALWNSLQECLTAEEFCIRIASAEERGRLAGERVYSHLAEKDPVTAAIFREIADDEVAHVALAKTFFGWTP
jgi:uncharacterized ferritin-like protein (DUF455 family)